MPHNPAKTFQDLVAWQKAHAFVLGVYRETKSFPADERFGLTSQFRRAAVSIAANIAEGFRRRTSNDKMRFLNTAQSSLEECRYFLILANDLDYLKNVDLLADLETTSRLLNAYVRAFRSNSDS